MTDRWDPANPHHKEVAHGIEVGDGIPEMRTIKVARQALKNVGFDVLVDEDLAERADQIVSSSFPLLTCTRVKWSKSQPWYYPLEVRLLPHLFKPPLKAKRRATFENPKPSGTSLWSFV